MCNVKKIIRRRMRDENYGVSEWKALRKETKLKLLQYAVIESKNRRAVS
jgi:hypothetical protein